jgi:hypothetical protein
MFSYKDVPSLKWKVKVEFREGVSLIRFSLVYANNI